MNTLELKAKLQKPYNREEWLKVAKDIFHNISILSKPLPVGNAKDFVNSFQQLGFVNLLGATYSSPFSLITANGGISL